MKECHLQANKIQPASQRIQEANQQKASLQICMHYQKCIITASSQLNEVIRDRIMVSIQDYAVAECLYTD